MTILPVAERELRVAARRKGTYHIRFVAALIALLIGSWIYLVSQNNPSPMRIGTELFGILASLAFGYTLLAGIRVTADCLSEEKRAGTLGLLFLTDLKGYDVVFGKLVATSMNSLYGLLAVLPILAVPLLMGGVLPSLVWHIALVLLDTLFLSLSAGLLVSAYCRHERKAMGGTFLLLLLLTAGPPTLGALWMEYVVKRSSPSTLLPFLLPSPAYAFGATLNAGSVTARFNREYWWSLLLMHSLGWLFLGLACYRLPHSWQDRPVNLRRLRWRERWQRWCFGSTEARLRLRTRLLNINPFLWLAGRDRLQKSLLWGFLGLLGVGFFWGYMTWRQDWLTTPIAISTAIILHGTLKFWTASDAVRRFGDIRREEALELIASSPMTVHEILHGQRLAFRRLFGKPLLLILGLDLLLWWMGLHDTGDREAKENLTLAFAVGIIALVADYHALIWLGLWLGLAAKNLKKAGGEVVGRILILPWFAWAVSVSLYGALSRPRLEDPPLSYFFIWWLFLGLLTDWILGRWAYTRLHRDFRTAAMSRFQPQARRRFLWLFRRADPH